MFSVWASVFFLVYVGKEIRLGLVFVIKKVLGYLVYSVIGRVVRLVFGGIYGV